MTELQASLIAIGGTIVVGVISYNKWQEYKARKTVQRAFSGEPEDVLMQSAPAQKEAAAGRQEPTFDGAQQGAAATAFHGASAEASSTADSAHAAQAEGAASEAAGQGAIDDAGQPQVRARAVQKDLPVDELIDCIIPFSLEGPVRGDKLLPKLQGLRHVGNKPVHVIGQRDDGLWEPVTQGVGYFDLQAGVQLANRGGALNEIEYSELIMRLRQIADEIEAEVDVPDMTEVMRRARSLHQFVAEYDAQLSVNVRSNGAPWAINTLLSALERQGFDLRPDGRLVMPDGEGGVLFSMSTNVTLAEETTSRLTLLLDVPRVTPARDGFGAMTACARMLASRLDGTVVDDGNQPLSDDTLAEIAGQVAEFYTQMEAATIPAGSVRALRLFS
ncbi:cell division protein ZipA C-terminal FtsZ-binding domain-containing protein [Noviherbaspirillum galbum]|uniref:Cell division protein ZipA n=1 Tax=Noviherbaspirillum galbum TaxID=2709383 RepID=A0A6B3SG15_9BURK|nr:cell division protein ZipA C-terminal FtsZ-binding domain-containing protein [Noviherbaspirillum galbum]NEX59781.1 cell division protein [Noviherbaspirillum galbum]